MGCNRQPIAAVRRVGAAPSILNFLLFSMVVRQIWGSDVVVSRERIWSFKFRGTSGVY